MTMPTCDMREDCANPVTHIGEKGYAYCTEHAPLRQGQERTRKMRAWERALIEDGKQVPSYKPITLDEAMRRGVFATKHEEETTVTATIQDLAREGSNILHSAANGGYAGRPGEVKRVLREIIDAIDATPALSAATLPGEETERKELFELVKIVRQKAEGDSNDEEIAAYRDALDVALGMLGMPDAYSEAFATE